MPPQIMIQEPTELGPGMGNTNRPRRPKYVRKYNIVVPMIMVRLAH